jgi:hypothetical protein
MGAGRRDPAIRLLNTIAARGGDSGDVRLHLCHALWGEGRSVDAIAECDRIAIDFSDHAAAIETAALFKNENGDHAEALDLCVQFLRRANDGGCPAGILVQAVRAALRSGRPLPCDVKSRIGEAAALPNADPQLVLHWEMLAAHHAATELWKQLTENAFPLEADTISIDRDLVSKLVAAEPPAHVISIGDVDAVLKHYNVPLAWPDAFERDGFTLPPWAPIRDRGCLTSDLGTRDSLARAAHTIQLRNVTSGMITLHSPFGQETHSNISTVLNVAPDRRHFGSSIAYFFREPRPCFAIISTEDQWPLAWYDPVTDVVLRHAAIEGFDVYLQDRVRELKIVWLSNAALANDYVNGGAGRGTALLVGMIDYLSTHVFTDLQGIDRLIQRGLPGPGQRIIVTGPEPLGQIEEIFPELAEIRIDRGLKIDLVDLNRHIWEQNLFVTRIAGGIVNDAMGNRLVTRARQLVDKAWGATVDALAEASFPLIFVSLRAHSRRWLASGADIATMFARLRHDHPGLALIFDGHSISDAPLDPALVTAEQAMIRDITDALPSDLPVLNSAGRSMEDAIYAAAAAHVHLSAQGTSATKAVLIAGKPGVVIGPRQFGWDVRAFREPTPLLLTPWADAVDMIEGDIQCDFALDTAIVARCLDEVILACGASATH